MLAQALGKHDTIGIDLVGMVVDDLVVCGAEPLFMTDYIACGKVVPERIADDRGRRRRGLPRWRAAPCVGGETAEHPGCMGAGRIRPRGRRHRRGGGRPAARPATGSAPATWSSALASSGVHSNGYSLVRHVLFEPAGLSLDAELPELGRTLGEELLEPTRIYSLDCLALARRSTCTRSPTSPAAASRATCPGSLPDGLDAAARPRRPGPRRRSSSWSAGTARSSRRSMDRTFNLGVGMVAIVPARTRRTRPGAAGGRGVDAWVLGEITEGTGRRVPLTAGASP